SLLVSSVAVPSDQKLFVNSNNTSYAFRKLEVRPLQPTDLVAATPRPSMIGPVDLVPLVDPKKPASGTWARDANGLTCSNAGTNAAAKLVFPLTPPPEYVLEVVAQRESGTDALGIGLAVGPSQASASFDNAGGKWGGLEMINGKGA